MLEAEVDPLAFLGREEVVVVPISGPERVKSWSKQDDAVNAFWSTQRDKGRDLKRDDGG